MTEKEKKIAELLESSLKGTIYTKDGYSYYKVDCKIFNKALALLREDEPCQTKAEPEQGELDNHNAAITLERLGEKVGNNPVYELCVISMFWKSHLEAAEKRIKELEDYEIFVKHIESHLESGQFVICKICGKSINEIVEQALKEQK
jgi:hypothetical protein